MTANQFNAVGNYRVADVFVVSKMNTVKKKRDRRGGKEARESGCGRDRRLCLYTEKWGGLEDAQSVNRIPGRCNLFFFFSSACIALTIPPPFHSLSISLPVILPTHL